MVTIIIGLCLTALSVSIARKKVGKWWMSFILYLIGVFIIVVGITAPLSGYNEYNIREEINLLSIGVNKEKNTDIYIIELENGDKIYKSIDENGKEKLETYYKSMKVEIKEEENCEEPKLVHYFRPIKSSIFSLGMFSFDEKYTFYIPKGSVIK